jgi:hypothetical protein
MPEVDRGRRTMLARSALASCADLGESLPTRSLVGTTELPFLNAERGLTARSSPRSAS